MKFTCLKHKRYPETYGMASMGPDGLLIFEETPIPLLQPPGTTKEIMIEAYKNGPIDATEVLKELENYEMVEVELKIVK